MNRGDIYAYSGLGRARFVAIVSNDGFNAITGHPLVVKVSDRPDLAESPYVVALGAADPVAGHLESYSAVRVRRDRLAGQRMGQLAEPTMRRLDDALALLFDHDA
ncbi:MAG TPA: type II toxin-antitoxin system PemK/MazF family toxin [Streptosporangiaceae bacterium]|nr:type II toxin-antitoxin system PemK/MazF family toxin [Streptosporangiaceae bacterium]